jgi:hypothetical protein
MTTDESEKQLADLIRKLRQQIVWKPGSATRHLLKRKLRGHLAGNATSADYEQLIQGILQSTNASIYIYDSENTPYLTVAASVENRVWLVIASFDGVVETAFVVENPVSYLERSAFRYIGKLGEVLA